MYQKPARCPDCDGGAFTGNGRCSHCHGSGVNLNLASEVPQCLFCKGSGVCATCDGAGMYPLDDPFDQNTIQTLFGKR
jgi:DnaJ-class molecular chaperone